MTGMGALKDRMAAEGIRRSANQKAAGGLTIAPKEKRKKTA